MQKGSFDEAARMYQELVRAVPGDAGLLMNLGMALAMGGHEPEAIGPLERAVKLKPALVPAQLFLGSSYLALGEAGKAVPPLKRAVAAEPANIEYRRLLARAYAESDRPLEAADELRTITGSHRNCRRPGMRCFMPTTTLRRRRLAASPPIRPAQPGTTCWSPTRCSPTAVSMTPFVYRETLEALPSMVSIRDSIARIYEQTGIGLGGNRAGERPPDRGAVRQAAGVVCVSCGPLPGRSDRGGAGKDPESRYWRARAAAELTKEALDRLDRLPDSRERREVRAAVATADRRYPDAVSELKAALQFAPKDPI